MRGSLSQFTALPSKNGKLCTLRNFLLYICSINNSSLKQLIFVSTHTQYAYRRVGIFLAPSPLKRFSHNCSRSLPSGGFQFIGSALCFSESVTHLGHVLHCKLEDDVDVTQVTSAMCRQSNKIDFTCFILLRGS